MEVISTGGFLHFQTRSMNIIKTDNGYLIPGKLIHLFFACRKLTVVAPPVTVSDESGAVTRVARGYSKSKGSKGYGYKSKKPKGYVYTTPRPKPGSETEIENDSQFIEPSEPPPSPVSPDRSALFTTTTPAPVIDLLVLYILVASTIDCFHLLSFN